MSHIILINETERIQTIQAIEGYLNGYYLIPEKEKNELLKTLLQIKNTTGGTYLKVKDILFRTVLESLRWYSQFEIINKFEHYNLSNYSYHIDNYCNSLSYIIEGRDKQDYLFKGFEIHSDKVNLDPKKIIKVKINPERFVQIRINADNEIDYINDKYFEFKNETTSDYETRVKRFFNENLEKYEQYLSKNEKYLLIRHNELQNFKFVKYVKYFK